MLFLPEIKLQKICNSFLKYIKNDLEEAITQDKEIESYLYLLFHDSSQDLNISTYYIQAKEIILREEDNQRFIKVRPIYDKGRAGLPTIHIVIPQDMEDLTQLGDFEGEVYEGTTLEKLSRGFSSQFGIMSSSDNIMEAVIMAYIMRASFLASTESLDTIGFINPKFGMQDISLRPELIPTGVYVKGLMISATYMETVPQLGKSRFIENVIFELDKINY